MTGILSPLLRTIFPPDQAAELPDPPHWSTSTSVLKFHPKLSYFYVLSTLYLIGLKQKIKRTVVVVVDLAETITGGKLSETGTLHRTQHNTGGNILESWRTGESSD